MKDLGTKVFTFPTPVFIIATYNEDGSGDAMNAAWCGRCGAQEIALNIGAKHQTTANIKKRGAFTVSFADKKNLVASDYVGLVSGKDEKRKLEKAGLHITKSNHIDAPIIDEFPLTLECKIKTITGDAKEIRVVGEVVNVLADASILNGEGKIDADKAGFLSLDSSIRAYRVLGEVVGKAFHDGEKLK